MEFFDMSQVHDVDPNVIRRTQQWLAGQQQPGGSWKPDTIFINRRRDQSLQFRRFADHCVHCVGS